MKSTGQANIMKD